MLFLNTYSEPLHEGWLEKLHDAFRSPGVGLAELAKPRDVHQSIGPTGFMIEPERFRRLAASPQLTGQGEA
ncbi:hypothetical protein, partial [Acinetobacter baumannii]|uniref:hypothetical protein n=1 Tax=Acinetobacter baumannii TaxID=470 RepID=UPI001BB46F6E